MAEKKRPVRMKSALQGLSPVAPQAEVPVSAPSPAPAPQEPKKAEVPTEEAPEKKWPTKVSFYQASEDGGRMRAAFVNTSMQEGTASLSEFIAKAIAKEVERLEAEYNSGEPWPAVHPRQVPKGPPRRWTS